MANMKLLCIAVLCMVLAAPLTTEAGLLCSQIKSQLAPCIIFLVNGGNPTTQCCAGVRNVVSASKTTPDRQSACNCLKSTAAGVKGININNAASLPGKCKVNIPYKISPSTNCAK
ncbi:hypothetical protein FNV43_RR08675 [Rhamnella rubrinervis]|uniref:Non-specific lipid-transfer protein n=1 Tax=Rhamnella rubrinervis TaxID=2594499 RepID=A0A8K0MJH1_9ROSA|nr:hypothetical protein FNV43_RR08675 [Rhamnella rubrinervis]